MIRFSSASSSRYLVFEQTLSGNGNVFKLFCDSIADVHVALNRQWARWQRTEVAATRLTTINGYRPGNIPAAMVKAQTRRYGRCSIAKAVWADGRAELGVIAL